MNIITNKGKKSITLGLFSSVFSGSSSAHYFFPNCFSFFTVDLPDSFVLVFLNLAELEKFIQVAHPFLHELF